MRDEFASGADKRFKPADAASPDRLRLEVTLTGVDTNVPVLSTITKLTPGAAVLNLIQTGRGKEGTFAGSVSFEVQAYDSTTNRHPEAYVSKQYPFAENIAASVGALEATRAGVRNGAEALVPELDRLAPTAAFTQAARQLLPCMADRHRQIRNDEPPPKFANASGAMISTFMRAGLRYRSIFAGVLPRRG